MSILRPKDGDYIVRGLFLLITWTFLGWVPFAVVGGILAGAGGAAVGLFGALVVVGPFLYARYLKLDPRVYPQKYPYRICECGCTQDMHIDTKTRCLVGCGCNKYRASHWWRTNSRDPHDWSV